ncbi:PREDICTED: F-box protein At1g61340-like isoform X2 [Lupinus angustifolius]|uniref:F-box protein At1g61340-like isoform X2 n=1 Tax=Lupinus angustifolius TaxID=3871 RepID=UPI00092F759D|nr:PREDICTED: F-box protein At1g61340-like isoform X2 [Lupinus angustifolius]
MAIELVDYSCTKTLGRKRVEASPSATPLKRMCSGGITFISENSPLEALPLDILIEVLCCVEHEDLNQLFHVSKTIREATLIAKGTYFEYRTPKKKTFVFYDPINNANRSHDIEAPNAPLRKSKSRIDLINHI